MFLFCLLCIIFGFLSSASLPDISVNFYAIASKVSLSIVLDEKTGQSNFKSIGPGVGIRRSPIVLLCFIIGKNLYAARRDKNFT